jgi:thiamine-monophosphate kinase
MTPVLEHQLIGRLAAGLPRSPAQLNALHESDAELVRLPGSDLVLALTTDGLAEEVATGLYADPWLIGWMLVTVNASDLAAVGADPLGVLLCETLPPDADLGWVAALQRGIADAAGAHALPVLGGDTNAGAAPHLAATAVGLVPGRPLTRGGARAGDLLFASGPLGAGGAYALARLMKSGPAIEFPFRPLARLAEGRLLRGIASACMDTSDGAVATLDELMTRNGVGFQLDSPLAEWTGPVALAAIRAAGLPPWMLHAGPHGEFELLFTVPPPRVDELRRTAQAAGWHPLHLGIATADPGLRIVYGGRPHPIDTTAIRNLFTECGGDVREYVRALAGMVPEGE